MLIMLDKMYGFKYSKAWRHEPVRRLKILFNNSEIGIGKIFSKADLYFCVSVIAI